MTTLFALLEPIDFTIIAGIVAVLAGGAAYASRQRIDLRRLESQMSTLEVKLDALLKNLGVELPPPPPLPPSGLTPEVERMALDPAMKIAAIKLYREQNPGSGLAEAKDKIEAFYNSRR